jgi:hypothetical protein
MKQAREFIILLVLSLLSSGALFAQENNRSGLRIEVRNSEGQRLGRACVTVVPREGEIVFRQCDRHGKITFKGLEPGSYRVVVKVDGYEAQKREVTVDERTETVAFTLQPRKL